MSSELLDSEKRETAMSGPGFNVMLFGKTGSGKSSLGNTLLGEKKFDVESGFSSGTKMSKWDENFINGVNLKVTDVPGLSDTHLPEKIILKETAKSVALVTPGPHVILFVISGGRRFTKEEYDSYLKMKELFTDRILEFMIVAVTQVDELKTTSGNRDERLKHALENAPADLKDVLSAVNDRYIGVENDAPEEDKQLQRKEMIKMIQALYTTNKGQHYAVPEDIDELVEEVVKRRAAKDGCTEEEARKIVKQEIVAEKQPELVEEVEKKGSKWFCNIL